MNLNADILGFIISHLFYWLLVYWLMNGIVSLAQRIINSNKDKKNIVFWKNIRKWILILAFSYVCSWGYAEAENYCWKKLAELPNEMASIIYFGGIIFCLLNSYLIAKITYKTYYNFKLEHISFSKFLVNFSLVYSVISIYPMAKWIINTIDKTY